LYLFDYYRRMELRKVTHENHYDVEAKFPVFENETWHDVWAVIYCSHENSKKLQVATSESPTHNPGGHIQDLSPVMETENSTLRKEDNMNFINAVLVTGEDEKGNDFAHVRFYNGDYADLYNEVYISEARFRALYPIVTKVYFSNYTMTGDQWRDIQCPLQMTVEQLEQWKENIQYVDAWADPRTPEKKETAYDFWHNADGTWKPFRSWASYPRRFSQPLSAEEVDDNLVGQ